MKADVAIAGAGVIGASVGWHLRRLGVRDVLLLEREAEPICCARRKSCSTPPGCPKRAS